MASRTPPKPTPTEVIDDYRSAYIALYGHPQPIVSRGKAGAVVVTHLDGHCEWMTVPDMQIETSVMRGLKDVEDLAA